VSFRRPARTLSWAVLNGGFRYADHVINHHVDGSDRLFCARPGPWLEKAAARLELRGRVVAMATAVQMKNVVRTFCRGDNLEVACFASVGCANALSVGDPATVTIESAAPNSLHTINIIVIVQAGLSDQAMVESVQIATEGRVRALYEAEVKSSTSNLMASGTGTDCIAVASLGRERARYCGKHTRLGELIGMATYNAVKIGILQSARTNGAQSD
jgi:adenosylcobinamide amidohydrolase